MTAVNTGLPGIRVPLRNSYASSISQQTAVFMYSTAGPDGQTVTLQLRETDEGLELPTTVLSKISYQNSAEVLTDGTIDLLLATTPLNSSGDGQNTNSPGFELFDSDNGHDLTLSPQTFTANTTADSFLVNDNSNSIGMPVNESDTVGSSEDVKSTELNKLNMSRRCPKPVVKAMSPNRQGPQQCLTCGKVFGNASALAKHKLTHSDERKYVCNVCSKAFKRQDHLNGHMLTHRHKKPFECKAVGCGKSYCDARSLRRHTENHHHHHHHQPSPPNQGSPPASPSSSTGSGCIQYAPAPLASPPTSTTTTTTTTASASSTVSTTTVQQKQPQPPQPPLPPPQSQAQDSPSQLQKLLSTEPLSNSPPTTSSKGGRTRSQSTAETEDSFTKQQLDLIQQIMQQTRLQIAASNAQKMSNLKNWNSQQNANQCNTTDATSSKQQNAQTTLAIGVVPIKPEQKPVECNLCHRKFKNVPALNGHMRLHGGYFKKETDSKKWEKKEASGPPLQTASMSVRALIEEKIIQKRITKPATQNGLTSSYSSSNRDKETTVQKVVSRSTSVHAVMTNNNSSFAVPAVPSSTASSAVDTTASSTDTTSVVYSDIILRKTAVKRACSDPGYQYNQSSTGTGTSTSPQIDINYRNSPYNTLNHGGSRGTGEKETDNHHRGYYSPGLNDDIFPNVQTDTMLLQAVDSAQLADTIRATDMQDMSCLDDYDGMTDLQNSEDFQAVLNSPLSASLADLAYSSGQTMFTDLGKSPLPSPSFTYPTPPASQEGHSPSLNFHSVMSNGHLGDFFYSSDMSSSEAVEAALSEVLPNFESATDSPVSVNTPVPSPMSLPNSSAAPSPLPNHHQHTLQVMMPNSEDPLLSSSTKEFRKKFDYQTCRLYGVNGTMAQVIDGSQFLIDKNGELKLVHANYQHNSGSMFVQQTEAQQPNDKSVVPTLKHQLKQEFVDDLDDIFINPSSIQSNYTNRMNRKRCFGDISTYKSFRSRLRCHRLGLINEPTLQYTPKPMLSPSRNGRGLYWQAVTSWPSSTTVREGIVEDCVGLDSPPECDVLPHINLGSNFQAVLPPFNPIKPTPDSPPSDYLLWDPFITDFVAEREVEMYMDFACCAAVPGGGRNKEYALHLLHLCRGNVQEAMLKLMQPTPYLPQGHPLTKFEYTESDHWTQNEVSTFHKAIFRYDKDFSFISQELGSKTLKQCVQFYYLWKKVCPEDYKQFQLQRRKSRTDDTAVANAKLDIPANNNDVTASSEDQQTFVCEFSDCLSTFNSKIGLAAHVRLHTAGTPDRRHASTPTQMDPNYEEFPCKICGKVFNKVKSRSAHMKSHRPPDAEPKKPKLDQNLDYGQMMQLKTVATPIQLHRQC
ncbi:uncharacterized protein LOC126847469 isoform X2 [Adelges cooleyi]|uniref:uncharacterized protein LOC126847469 isoform X2 n=1 Tax=Adelges cooleyi TaxID=133065 RepID=UPI00217FA22C|nr:uncharacterized protein LOC126847469 isoform X2 [Adelges cooleyi]